MPSSPAPLPPSSRPSARAAFASPSSPLRSPASPRVQARLSTGPSCDRLRRVAAQGRQMRHNSRVVYSTIYNSPKSAQILVGLTTCLYRLGKSRFTISRSRLIRISNSKIKSKSTIRRAPSGECEPQRCLIIMSCGFMYIEKREDGLQVIHTV